MRKYFLPLLISSLLALAVLFPILKTGVWYPMHDTTHIARLYLMEESIRSGQFPPIWASTINNGYGYPLFHFYAPAFYYLALIFKLLVGTYVTGLKLALFTYIAVGIAGVMQLASRWGRGASLLAAIAFGLSPYLALDLYVRGAFAEIAAMMLFPWVLYVFTKINHPRDAVRAGLITSLFLLSHNLVPVLAFPILVCWLIITHRRRLSRLILPSALTVLFSASYWLPLIFERSFVKADEIARVTDYTLHFVYPTQIWNSTWGFGGSGAGIEDGLSFKMGKVQLLMSMLGGAVVVWLRRWKLLFFPAAALFALFMSTTWAKWLWDSIPFLAVIQFPWRYLSLAGSLLAVSAALPLLLLRHRLARLAWVGVVVISLFYFNFKYFSPQWTFRDDEVRYSSAEYLDTVASIIPEYMPRWMPATPMQPAGTHERAYYPTWEVRVDGERVPTAPDESGILTFPNPTNSSDIVLIQGHTPLQKLSYALTLLGLVLSVYFWRKK